VIIMRIQNIRELIDVLEEIAQEHGDELPVRFASQPSYPLAHSIANVAVVGERVWLAEGERGWNEDPYAPKAAWEEQ
jgi:hypothetical protein